MFYMSLAIARVSSTDYWYQQGFHEGYDAAACIVYFWGAHSANTLLPATHSYALPSGRKFRSYQYQGLPCSPPWRTLRRNSANDNAIMVLDSGCVSQKLS